jgi:cell division protein FtsI/penicillin-binding protein 2
LFLIYQKTERTVCKVMLSKKRRMSKNNMLSQHKIKLIVCILLLSKNVFAFENSALDNVSRAFEETHGNSCAVILQAETARICYVYNAPVALERKFPPGSIAKTWSAVYFLENGLLSKTMPFYCGGKFYPDQHSLVQSDFKNFNLPQDHGKYYFRCSVSSGHKNITFRDALIKSCNAYFLTAASREPKAFYRGLNSIWHFTSDAETGDATDLQYASAAIGEGCLVRVTPAVAARDYAALFEGTALLAVHTDERAPRAEYPLAVSPATRSFILSALSETVKTGTLKGLLSARGVRVIAGKTGTATQYRKKYMTHGWAVVYFEYQNVRYVLVVFVERGTGPKDAKIFAGELLNAL